MIPWPLEDSNYFYFCPHTFDSFLKCLYKSGKSKLFRGQRDAEISVE